MSSRRMTSLNDQAERDAAARGLDQRLARRRLRHIFRPRPAHRLDLHARGSGTRAWHSARRSDWLGRASPSPPSCCGCADSARVHGACWPPRPRAASVFRPRSRRMTCRTPRRASGSAGSSTVLMSVLKIAVLAGEFGGAVIGRKIHADVAMFTGAAPIRPCSSCGSIRPSPSTTADVLALAAGKLDPVDLSLESRW